MENDPSSQITDKEDFTSSLPFMRAFMTALFVGISDSILCLVFNLVYRGSAGGFFSSALLNVSSIIFGVNILFILIGVLYFGFLRAARKGEIVFSILFVVFTIVGITVAQHIQRTPDPVENARFQGLLTGVMLIVGISAAIIPLLYHSRKFGEYVL